MHKDAVGQDADFLIDGIDASITIYNGNPVSISLPPHIVVQVTETEPGIKGDTATNVNKPAKISTGATVAVPLFINEGEWIRVDTRSRSYLERAKAPEAIHRLLPPAAAGSAPCSPRLRAAGPSFAAPPRRGSQPRGTTRYERGGSPLPKKKAR